MKVEGPLEFVSRSCSKPTTLIYGCFTPTAPFWFLGEQKDNSYHIKQKQYQTTDPGHRNSIGALKGTAQHQYCNCVE